MPDLKYLSRVLYILINSFFKQIVDIFLNNAYYQESYILIIEYSSVVQLTNRPQVITNQSEHLGQLKDLEISKYKRESKALMPIKFCCLFFVNCGLFSWVHEKCETIVAYLAGFMKSAKRNLFTTQILPFSAHLRCPL
jgi:hypothetical protein